MKRRNFLELGLGAIGASLFTPHTSFATEPQRFSGEPHRLAGSRMVFTGPQWISEGSFTYEPDTANPGHNVRVHTDRPVGISLTVARPERAASPVIATTQPWEASWQTMYSLIKDGGVYRAWGEARATDDGERRLAYYESNDGYEWTRPNLGGGMNLVPNLGFGSVFHDPGATTAERYKWVNTEKITHAESEAFRALRPEAWDARAIRSDHVKAIKGAVSPDGIAWTPIDQPLAVEHADTQVVPTYDTHRGTYVIYTRTWTSMPRDFRIEDPPSFAGQRSIGRMESSSFREMPLSKTVVAPPAWMPPGDSLYANGYTTLPGAPDHHMMFPTVYHVNDSMSVTAMSSVDGEAWSWLRPSTAFPSPNEALLMARGNDGQWDQGFVLAQTGMIELPNGDWAVPYLGSDRRHKDPDPSAVTRWGYANWPQGRLCAVSASGWGEFSTRRFYPPAYRMKLNIRCASDGNAAVEVVGPSGAAVPGRSFAASTAITGDHDAQAVTWTGTDTLGVSSETPIRLRFRLYKAELFGITFF